MWTGLSPEQIDPPLPTIRCMIWGCKEKEIESRGDLEKDGYNTSTYECVRCHRKSGITSVYVGSFNFARKEKQK